MAFTVPTLESSPTFDGQACIDTTDLQAIASTDAGDGVASGLAVTPSSLMVIAIAAGTALVNGVLVAYAGGTATVGAASTFDRRDIVTISSAGAIVVTAGAQGTVAGWSRTSTALPPVKPAIPANSTLLAEVYVAHATTTVATGNIIDKRCTLLDSGWQAFTSLYVNSWTAYVITGQVVAGYRLQGNTVRFRGAITGGASNTTCFTLPAGYRPTGLIEFIQNTSGGVCSFVITGAGVVTVFIDSGVNPCFFDGITFTID